MREISMGQMLQIAFLLLVIAAIIILILRRKIGKYAEEAYKIERELVANLRCNYRELFNDMEPLLWRAFGDLGEDKSWPLRWWLEEIKKGKNLSEFPQLLKRVLDLMSEVQIPQNSFLNKVKSIQPRIVELEEGMRFGDYWKTMRYLGCASPAVHIRHEIREFTKNKL